MKIVDAGVVATEPALELSGTTGGTGHNISDLTIDNTGAATTPPATAKGIVLNGAGTVNFLSAGTISLKTNGAAALDADTTNMGTGSVFDDITVTGSGSGGIRLFNLSGTTQLGSGSGTDLNLTTTSGTTAAMLLSSAGSVSVPGGGTANISANGGPALSVSGTTISGLDLDNVSSTDSMTHGISLSGLGAGTFAAASSSTLDLATAATGPAFSLDGGAGTVTFPGTINDGGGGSVSILSRSGGTVTMGGAINDGNDPGGGITVSSATGGSTVFSHGTKTLNTGASSAVVFSGSSNHTLTLSGGGLSATTTSGAGVQAQGFSSGLRNTLNVTGSTNTISTTTGRALDVDDIDVGATPLTFEAISATGSPSGIRLDDTGANNALTVAGGSTVNPCTNANTTGCTGGTIANATGGNDPGTLPAGTGVVLRDTKGVSLTRMRLNGSSNFGIRGSNVDGFTLANSVVHGNHGDAAGGIGGVESSIRFVDLTGSASIADSHVSGGFNANLEVHNDVAGTLNRLTLTANTFANNQNGGSNSVNLVSPAGSPPSSTSPRTTTTSRAPPPTRSSTRTPARATETSSSPPTTSRTTTPSRWAARTASASRPVARTARRPSSSRATRCGTPGATA